MFMLKFVFIHSFLRQYTVTVTIYMVLIVFIIINRKSPLYRVVADEEVQHKGDVGGGEDAARVVVNLLDIVEGVPASILGAGGGLNTKL